MKRDQMYSIIEEYAQALVDHKHANKRGTSNELYAFTNDRLRQKRERVEAMVDQLAEKS